METTFLNKDKHFVGGVYYRQVRSQEVRRREKLSQKYKLGAPVPVWRLTVIDIFPINNSKQQAYISWENILHNFNFVNSTDTSIALHSQ